jgi:phage shock protein C
MNTTTANPSADQPQTEHPQGTPRTEYPPTEQRSGLAARPLYRPLEDRMLAGVAAGIARYLGADVTLVRIALAVLAVAGGAGVPIYLAGWLLIPEEGRSQSLAADLIDSWQNRPR